MPNYLIIDLIGQRFGRLIVVSRKREEGRTTYRCVCDCGKSTFVRHGNLQSGGVTSCGCYGSEVRRTVNIRHGMSHDRTWNSWMAMRGRCHVATSKDFLNYGARGISVCARWRESFEAFFEDMGERPARTSIERKDNNGNYEPGNCVWASPIRQGNNKRNNHFVEFRGVTLTTAQWARSIGISLECLGFRLKNWSLERALTEPKNPLGRKRK